MDVSRESGASAGQVEETPGRASLEKLGCRTLPQLHAGGVGRQQQPTSCLVQPIVAHCCEVMYFGCFDFRGDLGFLNCDDVSMCVVNKQFELLEFVFESVYVDLQYDE